MKHLPKKIISIDPGQKRIGVAISDDKGMIAIPFKIIRHISRDDDAAWIADLARNVNAGKIIVGLALGSDNEETLSSRRAKHLAEAIKEQIDLPVELWDESESSNDARKIRIEMGVKKKKRAEHIDALAAAIVLQSYIDNQLISRAGK
jgi:putative Holliday junction resolvase